MSQFFCFSKHGFCEHNKSCNLCNSEVYSGGINLDDLNKILRAVFGDSCDFVYLNNLVKSEQNKQCITVPRFVWRIGETRGIIKVPYKPWMDRYMGTKFYKTEEEAVGAMQNHSGGQRK